MKDKEFVNCLENAINGNGECINQIIEEYIGLIKKYSKINGTIDEDCFSYIRCTVIQAIKKFKNL